MACAPTCGSMHRGMQQQLQITRYDNNARLSLKPSAKRELALPGLGWLGSGSAVPRYCTVPYFKAPAHDQYTCTRLEPRRYIYIYRTYRAWRKTYTLQAARL